MKIVIAPDSYKGALSAQAAAVAMEKGIVRAFPHAITIKCPMGDGGEGTLDALASSTGAAVFHTEVVDAFGGSRRAAWGWHSASSTTYVELAEACGLQYVDVEKNSIYRSTTYGVGQLINQALNKGAKSLVITLGGSATNDAGAGMLVALGGKLLDKEGSELPPVTESLFKLDKVDLSGLDQRLKHLQVVAAVDVDNPLLGANGASAIYGPQKGASPADVSILDALLANFSQKVSEATGVDVSDFPGAGAAGGMGYAAMAFLKATLKPGIDVVMQQVNFNNHLNDADLVITGEGRLDGQSLAGKTPIGIARVASERDIPVVIIAGQLGEGWRASYSQGVSAAFSLVDGPMSLAEAIEKADQLLSDRCESIIRLFHASSLSHCKLTNSIKEGFIIYS
ncbi:glycerate kinase [Halomonas casei]|uniref:glycerate kinase n=2 Tax=Halomonadaceae TaxID=28256 RepID=UPI0018668C2D|nr:glycerate kinase [Halomonas casei]